MQRCNVIDFLKSQENTIDNLKVIYKYNLGYFYIDFTKLKKVYWEDRGNDEILLNGAILNVNLIDQIIANSYNKEPKQKSIRNLWGLI